MRGYQPNSIKLDRSKISDGLHKRGRGEVTVMIGHTGGLLGEIDGNR